MMGKSFFGPQVSVKNRANPLLPGGSLGTHIKVQLSFDDTLYHRRNIYREEKCFYLQSSVSTVNLLLAPLGARSVTLTLSTASIDHG